LTNLTSLQTVRLVVALPWIDAPSSLLELVVMGLIKTQALTSLLASLPKLQALKLQKIYDSNDIAMRGEVLTLSVISTCLRYHLLFWCGIAAPDHLKQVTLCSLEAARKSNSSQILSSSSGDLSKNLDASDMSRMYGLSLEQKHNRRIKYLYARLLAFHLTAWKSQTHNCEYAIASLVSIRIHFCAGERLGSSSI
jgi:hypothetical protein